MADQPRKGGASGIKKAYSYQDSGGSTGWLHHPNDSRRDICIIRLRPTHPGHVWAMYFVHDKRSNGRGSKYADRA